ncbi:unnamed protein product [Camellia sinensis]
MAKPNMLCHLTTTILILLIISQSSSARPLTASYPDTLNLSLHRGAESSSQPCESMESKNRVGGRRYGPLFLTMLPKGTTVPPSGPSGGIN